MRMEIAKLHDDLKTTMIYVTHDQVGGDDACRPDRRSQSWPDRAGRDTRSNSIIRPTIDLWQAS